PHRGHDPGGAREPEADRPRRARRTAQAHGERGAQGHGAPVRGQGLPRGLGEGAARLDGRRARTSSAGVRMKRRAEHEAGYVLHTYPYKETSLIVEAFTRRFGRVAMLARGARRPRSAMRGVLLSFHPLRLSWSAPAELGNLISAEWPGGLRPHAARRRRRRLRAARDTGRSAHAAARAHRRAPPRAGAAYAHGADGAERPVIELGVNVDHVATVRQARRTYEPDPVWAAVEAHLGGADGITVHLREDRRHIQDEDVRRLRELTHIRLNLEMAATDEMVGIACDIQPEMAMLVPEGREEVTTEGGLDVASREKRLK